MGLLKRLGDEGELLSYELVRTRSRLVITAASPEELESRTMNRPTKAREWQSFTYSTQLAGWHGPWGHSAPSEPS